MAGQESADARRARKEGRNCRSTRNERCAPVSGGQPASSDHRCDRCGYQIATAPPFPRCPMCGTEDWKRIAAGRRPERQVVRV